MQGGFRHGRSTMENVTILDSLLQQYPQSCPTLRVASLDLRVAYDSVDRRGLWHVRTTEFGLPFTVIRALRALFDDNDSYLVLRGQRGPPIRNHRGLLQGSTLSPILFNVFINSLLYRLHS